jgi:hypothetical protein
MPIAIRSPRSRVRERRAIGATLVLAAVLVLAACSNPSPSNTEAPDGLVALVAGKDDTTLMGWDATGGPAVAIALPAGDTTWIATGRADVLAATLTNGKMATSAPIRLGKPLAWRTVKAAGPTGGAPKGPDWFATWDPEGGRFATLAGDLPTGDGIRVVLIDPSVGSAFEIPVDRSVVAAPPAWIDSDRLVVITGDAAAPLATIVDATTGELSDGPSGSRLVATSADGHRIATMDGQGDPVVVHDTAGWLSGDGSSIASVAPPSGSATAIAFALDATGDRLVVAWQAQDGSVTLAVHDGKSDWRRVAKPEIGAARGASVAWRR